MTSSLCFFVCVQTVRTWLRGVTASSSKSLRCSTTAWTSCWSASLDRYDCVKRDRRPPLWTLYNAARHRDLTTATHLSAAFNEQPSPRSENCFDVEDPSNPRPVTTSLYPELIATSRGVVLFKRVNRACTL